MNKNTKKQPWGPFIKQVLGPNVPWAWYIINLVVSMATTNVSMLSYTYQGQIMAGEAIGNTAILWQYIGLNVLYLAIAMLTGISGSWANYWTERKLQNRLWGKMIRMPMRLYDKQDPSSLISRVTGDTMQVTYSLTYVFTLVNIAYSLVLMLGMIWEMNSAITLSLLCVLPYRETTEAADRKRNLSYLARHLLQEIGKHSVCEIDEAEENAWTEEVSVLMRKADEAQGIDPTVPEEGTDFLTEEQVREKYIEKSRPFFRDMVIYAGVAESLSGQDAEALFQTGLKELAERSNMDVETLREKFQISDAAAHNQVFFNKAEEFLKERCEQLMEE